MKFKKDAFFSVPTEVIVLHMMIRKTIFLTRRGCVPYGFYRGLTIELSVGREGTNRRYDAKHHHKNLHFTPERKGRTLRMLDMGLEMVEGADHILMIWYLRIVVHKMVSVEIVVVDLIYIMGYSW